MVVVIINVAETILALLQPSPTEFYPLLNRHLIESGSELEPLEAVPVDLL
jgi:hypothetical protein